MCPFAQLSLWSSTCLLPSRAWARLPHLTSEQREDVGSHRNRQTSNFISASSQSLLHDRNTPQDRDRHRRGRGEPGRCCKESSAFKQEWTERPGQPPQVGAELQSTLSGRSLFLLSVREDLYPVHPLPGGSKAVPCSSPCQSILLDCRLPGPGNPIPIERWHLERALQCAHEPGAPGTRQHGHVSEKVLLLKFCLTLLAFV